MQTHSTHTDRQQFLLALLDRQAATALGDERSSRAETASYGLGYLTSVIASVPSIYELVIEELASLGVTDPR